MILLFFESPSLLPWSVARAKVDKKPGLKACSGALSLATGNTNDWKKKITQWIWQREVYCTFFFLNINQWKYWEKGYYASLY